MKNIELSLSATVFMPICSSPSSFLVDRGQCLSHLSRLF